MCRFREGFGRESFILNIRRVIRILCSKFIVIFGISEMKELMSRIEIGLVRLGNSRSLSSFFEV